MPASRPGIGAGMVCVRCSERFTMTASRDCALSIPRSADGAQKASSCQGHCRRKEIVLSSSGEGCSLEYVLQFIDRRWREVHAPRSEMWFLLNHASLNVRERTLVLIAAAGLRVFAFDVIECTDALDGFSCDSNRWGGRNVIHLFERSSFGSAAVVLTIKCAASAPYSVKVLRHGTLHPSLVDETCDAPLTDRSVAVRRAGSFGFAGDTSPGKSKIGSSRVGGARFFNA